MALTTFSDATKMVASEVNDNFQDEESNEATARSGRLGTQRYRLGVAGLLDSTIIGKRSLIIKPISLTHVYSVDVLVDNLSAAAPVTFYVQLECLTTPRALNNKTQSVQIASGAATPIETTVDFEGTPTVLQPGLTYRLSIVHFVGGAAVNNWTEVVMTTYRSRSNN